MPERFATPEDIQETLNRAVATGDGDLLGDVLNYASIVGGEASADEGR